MVPLRREDLKGWPVMTLVRGKVVYKDGKVMAEPGWGKYIERKKQ